MIPLTQLLTAAIAALISSSVSANQAFFQIATTAQGTFPWPVPNPINQSLYLELN